jgi:glycosyltransferase involved in cell wall biosynthesis
VGTEIAILVSSYQRPGHLEKVLVSIEQQQGVEGKLEVVVTDDGSKDESEEVVERFAERVSFPVQWTTHRHEGFQLARCRNEGVVVSRAPYLLFLDGDCLIPPDHVQHHLACRRVGCVWAGYCCLLTREVTEPLTLQQVREGAFVHAASRHEFAKLARMHRKAQFYNLIGHPTKPKLYGGNVGIYRCDLERVNGYDENFRGWGCEDDDLRLRLRARGRYIKSILGRTCTYHLWHPPGSSTPAHWRDGPNVSYLRRKDRPSICENGLSQYASGQRSIRVRRWNMDDARSPARSCA